MKQKGPLFNNKNTDIINNWLSEHNTPQFDETMELHLHQLILIDKLFYMKFFYDHTGSNYGHIFLFTSYHHKDMNPITTNWAQLK